MLCVQCTHKCTLKHAIYNLKAKHLNNPKFEYVKEMETILYVYTCVFMMICK